MGTQGLVGVVVEAPDRRVLDRAVHPFDLAVRPRMVKFGQAMVDVVLRAGEVECMCAKQLMASEHLLNLTHTPAAVRSRELKAVVGQHGVDTVRHAFDQLAEEVSGYSWCRPLM